MKYSFNEDYNIIIIKDNGFFEYYLQKKGYGDLRFMFGIKEKTAPINFNFDYLYQFIETAEKDNFWGCELWKNILQYWKAQTIKWV